MERNPVSRGSSRVLIVEDNEAQLRTLATILRHEGFDVAACATGTEALEYLANNEIDVAVVDLRLPDIEERELLDKLGDQAERIPIIIHTGYGSYTSAREAINTGAFAYVEKGADPGELIAHVHRAIQTHLRRRAGNLEAAVAERTRALQQANESLRASEERYRSTLDNMMEGCQLIGFDWRYSYVNDAAAAHGRRAKEDLLGRSLTEIHPAIDQTEMFRFLRRCMEERRPYQIESEFTYPDGSTAWFDLRIEPAPEGIFILSIDITERKRAEEELAKAKDAAEAASRAKSEFLAAMSHEIRTPLAAITGFADLLLSQERSPQERHEYLATIRRNAESLLAIINDILDLAKIEAEKLQIEQMDWSPRQVVEEVEAMLRDRANQKRLSLEIEYVEPLPPAICTDPGRLRQILVNLVGNAIKFTDCGGVRVTVRSLPGKDGRSQMRFEVADTGIGISAQAIRDLFEPFTQADMSSTRSFGGTGLGLSISQRLAEMLGGKIEVQSQTGKGSTFTLTIDAQPPWGAAPPATPSESRKRAPADLCRSLDGRVLLAEDMPDMVKLIRCTLEKTSLRLDVADNGLVAHEKAMASKEAGEPYDLILMDIRMPVMDGHEATRRLREDGWEGPIVALTAHSMRGDREQCLKAGCDDYLSKPVSQAEFFRILERYLACRDAAGEASADTPAEVTLFDGLLDDATVGQLVQEYAGTLSAKAEALEYALRSHDLDSLAGLAHELKGAAGMYGFPQVSEAAFALKQLAVEDDGLAQLEAAVSELARLCREAAQTGRKKSAKSLFRKGKGRSDDASSDRLYRRR